MHFGFSGPATERPVLTLFLSLGPLLVPAALGLWPRRDLALARAVPAAITAGLGLLFAYTLVLKLDLFWVGFRSTQIMLAVLPALAARFLARGGRPIIRARLAAALGVLLLLVGLPTTVIDAYNAQDISNRAMGPGFRWTVAITPDEQAALDVDSPRDAARRGGEHGADSARPRHVDPHPESRRAPHAGRSAHLAPQHARLRAADRPGPPGVRDPRRARRRGTLARRLGIDYVYLDQTERSHYPAAAIDKFGLHPELFAPVFHNLEAEVFEVRGTVGTAAQPRR